MAIAGRRRLIKVLGTSGVVLAAGGIGLTQCDPMPAEAVEAWSGPGADETDPRRWALAHAILAPNPHNMQPWLVDLREPDALTLYVDRERLLPETDPFARQILIGHGTFLELLRIAAGARGLEAGITYFPDGFADGSALDGRPVARVGFRPSTAPADPLFAQVLARRSNKEAYDLARPPLPAHLAALQATVLPESVALRFETEPGRVADLRRQQREGTLIEMGTPRTLRESVERTRVGGAEIARHRDGIDLNGPMFWWIGKLGLMTPEKAMTPGTFAHQGGLDYAMGFIDGTPAFGVLLTSGNDRAAQLDSGRAYLRLNLAATAVGLGMHPVSQLLQEFPEMAGAQARFRSHLGVAADTTVQMLFRMGYAEAPGPSPRRPLGAILLS